MSDIRTFLFSVCLVILSFGSSFSQVYLSEYFYFPTSTGPTVCPNTNVNLPISNANTPNVDLHGFCSGLNMIVKTDMVIDFQAVGGQVQNSQGQWVSSTAFTDSYFGPLHAGMQVPTKPPLSIITRWFYTNDGDQSEQHYYQITTYYDFYCNGNPIPYRVKLGSNRVDLTLRTPFNKPHSLGNTGFLKVDDTNAGLGSLCAGDKVTFTTYVDNSTPSKHRFTWEFFYQTGPPVPTSPQLIGTSTNEVDGVLTDHGSIEFTVPEIDYYSSGSHPIRIWVHDEYYSCPNAGSIEGWSAQQNVYPSAPDFTYLKTDAICEGGASIAISGTSFYDQVKIRIFREDALDALTETVLNFNQTSGFYYTEPAIPPVDPYGTPIAYRLQVGNYDSSNPNFERCYSDVALNTFNQTINTVEVTPVVTNELCYDPSIGTGSISLTAGGTGITAPYTYNWSTGATGSSVTNLAGDQEYKVIVKDANGCKTSPDTLTYRVEEPDPINFSLLNVEDVSCASSEQGVTNDGIIEVTANGGSGNFQYSLDGAAFSNSPTFQNLVSGLYTLRVKDGPCVQDLANNPVTIGKPVSEVSFASINKFDIECAGASVTEGRLEVIGATGGQSPYTYSLDNVVYNSSQEFRFLAADTYDVFIRDANDCVVLAPPVIISSNALSVSVSDKDDLACADDANGSATIVVTGGQAPYAINWSNGEATLTATNLSAGDHSAVVTDVNGCIGNGEVTINAPQPITLVESFNSPTCLGDDDGSITVAASGGNGNFTYTWGDGATGTARSNLLAGDYSLTVLDQQGCEAQYEVVLVSSPVAALGEDKTICSGQPVTLSANIPGSYTWSSDNGFASTDATVTVSDAGVYKVVIVDVNNCVSEDEVAIVTSTDLMTADFLMISEAYEGDTIVLIDISWPTPDATMWNFPPEANVVTAEDYLAELRFDAAGVYTVSLSSKLGGCWDEYESKVTVLEGMRPTTGGRVANDELIRSIKINPNPTSGTFDVSVELREVMPIEVRVVNVEGARVLLETQDEDSDFYEWRMNIENYPAGIYFVTVRAGEKVKIVRLVKL